MTEVEEDKDVMDDDQTIETTNSEELIVSNSHVFRIYICKDENGWSKIPRNTKVMISQKGLRLIFQSLIV